MDQTVIFPFVASVKRAMAARTALFPVFLNEFSRQSLLIPLSMKPRCPSLGQRGGFFQLV
ncbi:MAG: hypothetical protein ACFFAU_20310 [Candidatus Hodarchaeota archaeon]